MTGQYRATGARMDLSDEQLEAGIKTLHFAYPLVIFSYFLISISITVCTLQTQRLRAQDAKVRRNVMLGLIAFVAGTYFAEAVTVGVGYVFGDPDKTSQHRNVYLLASSLVFGAQALALTDSQFPVWYPYYGTWIVGAIVEILLVWAHNWLHPPTSAFDFINIVEQSLRICTFLTLLALYFTLRNDPKQYDNTDAESQSLLRKKLAPESSGAGEPNGYGATTDTNGAESETAAEDTEEEDSWLAEQRKAKELIAKRLKQDGNWFTYAKGFTIFFPHIWPYHSKKLQFRAVLVALCLLTNNALNVLIPTQMGNMIDSLTKYKTGDVNAGSPYWPVLIYAALRFVGSSACIGWTKKWLWLPLEQYAYDALSTASHAHLMSLSSDFHDGKTSSDLTQAVQGGRSVSQLLETVCFQVIPMFIDLAVAFTYLWSLYGPYMGLLMASTVTSYLYLTTKLIASRSERRRKYVTVYRKEWTIGQQSLDGWNTASLFNMIPYEQTRYASAVKEHLSAKRSYELSSQATSAAQGLLMTGGLLGALFLGVYQVTRENQSVGKFTTLLVYWAQLQGPLQFFSSIYRTVSYSLMDAERLLELFQTKPTITDLPNAKPLKLSKGVIKFDRVSFAYDERKPTLKDVSFTVPAGKTVALVGETGGGKSTMLKLIDRFYDCKSGSISIDGQDIRDVQLSSLREKIGVVPQDPMLFNDTIMNNIRYARMSATDREVYEACKAAAVHDKIMSFPDGYNSKVGDRGVKLSGGEKQRVAIARAILKKPDIILLDEATSAVDTETEQLIQEGFNTLCRGRTTFIVAHRLSTIMKADHILVVMNGEIIESGSHHDLVHSKGKYHDLWSKQIFVTPETDRSRSKSPKRDETHIINDVTSSTHKKPLLKVMKSIDSIKSRAQSGAARPESGGTTGSDNKKSEGVHKREGSKLKADAPEFIRTRPPNAKDGMMGDLKQDTKEQKKQEKEERRAASLARNSGKRLAKAIEAGAKTTMDNQSAGSSIMSKTEEESIGLDKHKLKKSRSARRNSAKSDPNPTHESLDSTVDTNKAAVGSGEGQGPAMRRVSAPSDSPSTQDSHAPRRRLRHWRLKNRDAERSGSNSHTSGSTDDQAVFAPAPSPAEGVVSVRTPTVRFATGT